MPSHPTNGVTRLTTVTNNRPWYNVTNVQETPHVTKLQTLKPDRTDRSCCEKSSSTLSSSQLSSQTFTSPWSSSAPVQSTNNCHLYTSIRTIISSYYRIREAIVGLSGNNCIRRLFWTDSITMSDSAIMRCVDGTLSALSKLIPNTQHEHPCV